jgi:hypothetical protein
MLFFIAGSVSIATTLEINRLGMLIRCHGWAGSSA